MSRYDIKLINSYLLPILVKGRDIEPIVIKRTNHFVSFKLGKVHFPDILNFLGVPIDLDFFL